MKLIPIVIALLLASCNGTITKDGVAHAIESCKQFGGLESIAPIKSIKSDQYHATCMDGRKVEW